MGAGSWSGSRGPVKIKDRDKIKDFRAYVGRPIYDIDRPTPDISK